MFHREKMESEFLKIFRDIGMGSTIWSPLASGLLTGKYNNGIPAGSRMSIPGFDWLKEKVIVGENIEKVKKLKPIADKLGSNLASLSIAWCIKNPNTTTAILGATKRDQLTQNLEALKLLPLLSEDVLKEIEEIVQTKPIQPEY
jgi:aryl-alcohol dehydrogenase-like predicted oxidoreductase